MSHVVQVVQFPQVLVVEKTIEIAYRWKIVEIPEIHTVQGVQTCERLSTALVRHVAQAEIVENVEVGTSLLAGSVPTMFVMAPVFEASTSVGDRCLHVECAQWIPSALTHPRLKLGCVRVARGRSSAVCGWPRGRPSCGWPAVVVRPADGPRSSGRPSLRMAGGRPPCGWPVDGGRSSADGRRSSADGRRSSADGRRSSADGRRSSSDGRRSSRLAVVVRWVRSGSIVAGWDSTPPGRLLDPGPAVVSVFCRTTDDDGLSFRILHKKMSVRGWGWRAGARACTNALLERIDGEPMEFEWNIFPGFNTLQLCHKVQELMSRLSITPEKFTGRIIFMVQRHLMGI